MKKVRQISLKIREVIFEFRKKNYSLCVSVHDRKIWYFNTIGRATLATFPFKRTFACVDPDLSMGKVHQF